MITLFHNIVEDYAYGIFARDGIYIPKPVFDMSKEGESSGYSHTFRIYNLRLRRLTVQAEADCGCTGISWKSATIAPFCWKDLAATIKDRRVTSLEQQKSVDITISTDSRSNPYLFAFLKI